MNADTNIVDWFQLSRLNPVPSARSAQGRGEGAAEGDEPVLAGRLCAFDERGGAAGGRCPGSMDGAGRLFLFHFFNLPTSMAFGI